MAKELPYFKFEPSEWLEGNIQICSDEAVVCFINLASGYWLKLGELSYAFALQKYCRRNASIIQELIDNEIITLNDDKINIKFLDDLLNEREAVSDKRRRAAEKRWNDANALQVESKSNAKREEKRREKKNVNISFIEFWNLYDKKIGNKIKCEEKWNRLKDSEREKIIDTLPKFKSNIKDKQYQPHPLTYLNNRRWEDEIQEKENLKYISLPKMYEMYCVKNGVFDVPQEEQIRIRKEWETKYKHLQ